MDDLSEVHFTEMQAVSPADSVTSTKDNSVISEEHQPVDVYADKSNEKVSFLLNFDVNLNDDSVVQPN